MKGHKLHPHTSKKIEGHIAKHRKTGGRAESPSKGTDDAEKDLASKPERRNNAPKIEDAAEERKHGGRAKKHMGKMHEEAARKNGGRAPRKRGGGVESNPFSSALHVSPASGRKLQKVTEGRNE